ncbi:M20/M25/M40 family metallo-hydrolase [Deminuibacter soli]|uniref:Carboxypeptidase Q n=1 Tax=Deminuibacter soli TaxID=2291815 RepID=A0A3E1NP05_9BACT|nr:M20/M25/M40 family metallo-hydrolase [Deminuibacter soli]RFM29653.1 M20/M25/M40 family metallo-hydrolase [Deminuibacter soli]
MKKLVLLLCFPAAVMARTPGNDDSVFIRKIANSALTERSTYQNLYNLTKKVGGRLAGSPGMVKAELWGADALKAAGADKVILQECMVPHWVRGGKDKASFIYTAGGKQVSAPVNVLALGNSVGTGAKGVKAELIRVHSFDELDARKNEVKGKIVLYDVPFEETFVQTFEAYGKNVIYRAIGASRAAKYGAVAVWVRSMSHSVDNNPHTGSLRYLDSIPQIPAAAVGLRDMEKLDSLLDQGKTLTGELYTYGKMLPDTIGHNVIGELKGTEHPEQIITVGGHLDSWDVNEGATDDGAGVVQTIAILKAFKETGYRPKHTIHFVLFANEENGTRGGKKYAEAAKAAGEQHLFALESDAGGFAPRGFTLGAPASLDKFNSYKPLFAPYGVEGFTAGGGGADVDPLHAVLGTAVSELRPDSQRYFDVHHAANDVLENVNIRELKLGAVNMAALLYLVDQYGL